MVGRTPQPKSDSAPAATTSHPGLFSASPWQARLRSKALPGGIIIGVSVLVVIGFIRFLLNRPYTGPPPRLPGSVTMPPYQPPPIQIPKIEIPPITLPPMPMPPLFAPAQPVMVRATAGGTVSEVLAKANEFIVVGQPILRVDAEAARANLDTARSALRKVRSEAGVAPDGQEMPEDPAQAANVRAAQAALDLSRLLLASTEVKAPVSGFVNEIKVAAGEQVSPGQIVAVIRPLYTPPPQPARKTSKKPS